MAEDYYTQVAKHRLGQIDAEKAAHQANLMQFRAEGDMDGGAHAAQQIANLEAERNNILALHQQHVNATAPQPQRHWRDKRTEEMNYNDVAQMLIETSSNPNPHFDEQAFRAGIDYVQRNPVRR
jgi:hypothetical protein